MVYELTYSEKIDLFPRSNHADTSTLYCKCGQSFTWSGADIAGLREWVAVHASHQQERKVSTYA